MSVNWREPRMRSGVKTSGLRNEMSSGQNSWLVCAAKVPSRAIKSAGAKRARSL
jgi:hypothetical protein